MYLHVFWSSDSYVFAFFLLQISLRFQLSCWWFVDYFTYWCTFSSDRFRFTSLPILEIFCFVSFTCWTIALFWSCFHIFWTVFRVLYVLKSLTFNIFHRNGCYLIFYVSWDFSKFCYVIKCITSHACIFYSNFVTAEKTESLSGC